MDIIKSSRHSKIVGDFGESLILYWLSKYGFECARVDHTGIDLIARHPKMQKVMGISVKSRTRCVGTESDHVIIKRGDFKKLETACTTFGCIPYFGIVIDADKVIRVFITSMAHFLELFPRKVSGGSGWRMSDAHLAKYAEDPAIIVFDLQTNMKRWWS